MNEPTRLKPLGDRVVVLLDSRQAVSKGGIAIPERAQKPEEWGLAIMSGPTCQHVIPGDRVFIPAHLGTHYIENGQDYIIIEETRIICRESRVYTNAAGKDFHVTAKEPVKPISYSPSAELSERIFAGNPHLGFSGQAGSLEYATQVLAMFEENEPGKYEIKCDSDGWHCVLPKDAEEVEEGKIISHPGFARSLPDEVNPLDQEGGSDLDINPAPEDCGGEVTDGRPIVRGCSACGEDHFIDFKPITPEVIEGVTYDRKGLCPTTEIDVYLTPEKPADPDDDLGELDPAKACKLEGGACESCQ